MTSRRFQDVTLWQKANACVVAVYRLTRDFPGEERYGLTAQLRHASSSVTANFAEGFKKRSRPEKARFYNTSQCSIEECKNFLMLAQQLGYADTQSLLDEFEEVSRMLEKYVATMLAAENLEKARRRSRY